MDKGKNNNNNEMDLTDKPKTMQEEILSKVQLKSIEKECLDRVFNRLCSLQEEPSSDDDSKQKKYLTEIQKKASLKKMKMNTFNNTNFKSRIFPPSKADKKFKEDEPRNNSALVKNTPVVEEPRKRIGVKAIRKIIRFLRQEISKEEMDLMIWEVDENLDDYVTEKEFEKMYKRCIIDTKEQEPKRMFYLVQFLMYDKENKGFITEEDTLEILYIRHEDRFTAAIEDIFENKTFNEKGVLVKRERKESLNYLEFADKMNFLSSQKRKILSDKKKNYCGELLKKIRDDLIK